MKRELKDFIHDKFSEKAQQLAADYQTKRQECLNSIIHPLYKDLEKFLETSKTLTNAIRALGLEPTYAFSQMTYINTPGSLVNVAYQTKHHAELQKLENEFLKAKEKLRQQESALTLRLALEKDFDVVQKILKKAGIPVKGV